MPLHKLILWFGLASAMPFASFSQDFSALPDGGVKHGASGWVFPKAVGEFQRTGDPVIAAGTRDAVGQYERTANGLKTSATVYVYPSDSNAVDATLEGAKRAAESNLASIALAQSWSEGPFKAGSLPLVGEKVFYKIGIGPSSTQTNLYFFDTGRWVVKFRLSPQKTEVGTFQSLDAFVRDQAWAELGLTAENCTGSACRPSRPVPVHGAMAEQIALMMVGAKIKEVFPKAPACEESSLVTALTAPESSGSGELVRIVTSCSQGKAVRASFLRYELDADMREAIEAKSPDGLSLRGPITFMARTDGKSSVYTMLFDGPLDVATAREMLEVVGGKSSKPFATADKRGQKPQLETRFIRN